MVQEEQERLILLLLQQAIVLSRTSKINDFSLLALLFERTTSCCSASGFFQYGSWGAAGEKKDPRRAESEWTAAPPRSEGPLTATTVSSARHRPQLPLLAQVKDRVWRRRGGEGGASGDARMSATASRWRHAAVPPMRGRGGGFWTQASGVNRPAARGDALLPAEAGRAGSRCCRCQASRGSTGGGSRLLPGAGGCWDTGVAGGDRYPLRSGRLCPCVGGARRCVRLSKEVRLVGRVVPRGSSFSVPRFGDTPRPPSQYPWCRPSAGA